MQIGFVGLGRMGGNMVHRILRDSDHEVVAYDPGAEAVKAAVGVGANAAESLEDLVSKLDQPRAVWLMVPSGPITQQSVEQLIELMDEGDLIIDGGNSKWTDSKAHADAAAAMARSSGSRRSSTCSRRPTAGRTWALTGRVTT